jgi:hypothetical protein
MGYFLASSRRTEASLGVILRYLKLDPEIVFEMTEDNKNGQASVAG